MSPRDLVPELAAAIEGERKRLRLSPKQFAEATGLTQQGLLPLRQGVRRNYQQRLTDPVCKLFKWSPDSITRLQEGLSPEAAPPDLETDLSLGEQMARLQSQIDDLYRVVTQQGALLATMAAGLQSRPEPRRRFDDTR